MLEEASLEEKIKVIVRGKEGIGREGMRRDKRGLEGQNNEWKSAAGWWGQESEGSLRDSWEGRLPGINVGDLSQDS